MKIILGIALAASLLCAVPAKAQETAKVAGAQAAATSWLALTDAGNYSRSWDEAAGFFQAAVAKPNWTKAVSNARQPLGSLKSRKVDTSVVERSLPGAPDGEYVVIHYQTQFEHKESAVETLTLVLEKDGSWKVAGYYIR